MRAVVCERGDLRALHLLAEGKVDAAGLVTGTVGLDGVEDAFDELARPSAHAKVVIDPRSSRATLPTV